MPPRIAVPLLVAVSVAFRLPALVHAAGTNSDAAVVGLQALHLLRGEHGAFLWGSGYQTSADAYVAAAWFALLGPTPFALMLSTLAGHVAATLLAYGLFRRHMPSGRALLLASFFVFTTSPVHTYVLYPPRQASLTLLMASLFVLDGAARDDAAGRERARSRSLGRLWLGAAVGSLAVAADPYALVGLPAAVTLAAFVVAASGPGVRARALGATALGFAMGLVPYALLLAHPAARHGTLGWSAARLAVNTRVLFAEALPWLVGTEVYAPRHALEWLPTPRPWPWRALSVVGVVLVVAAVAVSVAWTFRRQAPASTRRLVAAGAALATTTLVGFLGSVMVQDRFAARYLVTLAYAVPFLLAPVVARLRTSSAVLALAPALASQALAGWAGLAPFVRGLTPVAPRYEHDHAFGVALREAGVTAALADYWVSYRLTFLFHEEPPVAPVHAREDRHPPYRLRFAESKRVAYIHDPYRSRESDEEARSIAASLGTIAEVRRVAGVTAYVIERRADGPVGLP